MLSKGSGEENEKWVVILLTYLKRNPYVLLVLANLFWGSNFVLSRVLVQEFPPIHLSIYRWSLATMFFLPFAIREFREHYQLLRQNWFVLLLLSLTGIAGFNSLLYVAVQYTTAINASLVNSISPVVIALLSLLLLREKMIKIQYFGMIISTVGVIWIITGGHLFRLLELRFQKGDVIALAAVLSWAIYSVMMKKFGSKLPAKATFLSTLILGTLILLPFWGWEMVQRGFQYPLGVDVWGLIIYLAIVPSLLSFTFWNQGVLQIGASTASIFLHLIVLFTGIFSIFIGEYYSLVQLIGACLIISGVVFVTHPQTFTKGLYKRST